MGGRAKLLGVGSSLKAVLELIWDDPCAREKTLHLILDALTAAVFDGFHRLAFCLKWRAIVPLGHLADGPDGAGPESSAHRTRAGLG
jgi:hypothetical protein